MVLTAPPSPSPHHHGTIPPSHQSPHQTPPTNPSPPPLPPDCNQIKGLLEEARGAPQSAMRAYTAALASDSCHVRSLVRLSVLGRQVEGGAGETGASMSRVLLAQVARQEAGEGGGSSTSEVWREMGLAAQAEGDVATAVQCFERAVEMEERGCPVRPFASLAPIPLLQ